MKSETFSDETLEFTSQPELSSDLSTVLEAISVPEPTEESKEDKSFTPTRRTQHSIQMPDFIQHTQPVDPNSEPLSLHQLELIEDAFLYDLSIPQALNTCNVTAKQFERHISRNPEHALRLTQLKANNTLIAKKNITKQLLAEDKATTLWYAETKLKDEYSKKLLVDNTHEVKVNLVTYDTTKKAIKQKQIKENKNELLTYGDL